MILTHPLTGRKIEVADSQAEDWQRAGWLDEDAAAEAEANKADQGAEGADTTTPEGVEGDTVADVVDVEPAAPAKKTTTTRGGKK